MPETTPETNATKPAAQEVSQNLATTTPDAESSPPVIAAITTPLTESEARAAVADPKVDTNLISESRPVIATSERAPEQVSTPVVPLEQPSATPANPGQLLVPTSPPESIQVEPATNSEATRDPVNSVLVPPENVAEPPMSSTADPQPTTTDSTHTTLPAVTTTEAQPIQTQPTTKVPEVPSESQATEKAQPSAEPQNTLTQRFTEAEWSALKELRVSVPFPAHHDLTHFPPTGPTS